MCNCGEPDREQVERVKEEVEADLLSRPGVTGVSVGYKVVGGRTTARLAIRVYVKHKHDVPEGEAIPKVIRGIPTDVIERRFVLHAGQEGGAPANAAEKTEEDPARLPKGERNPEMKTVSDIKPVKEAREEELFKIPGVTGVGINYKIVGGQKTDELAIRVYVEKKKEPADIPEAEKIPKTIKGVKTDVIERTFKLNRTRPKRFMAIADMEIKSDTGTYDPMKGGISIGPCRSVYLDAAAAACHGAPAAGNYIFVGTLGCWVRDNETDAEMMLSNFHVMCVDDGWHVGDTIAQPSLVDGGHCPADVVGSLQRAVLSDEVDAAVASHTARDFDCSIVDIGDVKGTATAAVGMAVRKRGRTSGLTYGNVTDTNLTVTVPYCDGLGDRTLIHQIEIEVDPAQSAVFGQGGDSGSVVVNSDNKVVGLYFAGDSTDTIGVANPIASVLSQLNVRVCTKLVKKWEPDHVIKARKEISHEIIKKREPEIKKNEYDINIKKSEADIQKGKEWEYGKGANEPIIGDPMGPVVNPVAQAGGGSVEERLAAVEAALAQVAHFIQSAARPDLDRAALQNEGDAPCR